MIVDQTTFPKGATRVGWLEPERQMEFTVVLAARKQLPSIHSANSLRSPHLTHEELRRKHGALPGAVGLIESFAKEFKLTIADVSEHRRNVRLSARAADIARAFHTVFGEFELDGMRFFAPTRPLSVSKPWDAAIETVLGLHSSPHARPRRRSPVHGQPSHASVPDLAQAYGFPPRLDGEGQTVGLIEFGGGFHPGDIEQFCNRLGIPSPHITVVEIGSGANRPAPPHEIYRFLDVVDGKLTLAAKAEQSDAFVAAQSTVEVTMDLEILAALAPAAHIVVYFASADGQGLYHAINRAVHDEQHRPAALSISWSLPEETLSPSEIRSLEGVLQEAAHLGITVCASSGDAGALNDSADKKPSVNYPASSPHCLGCGGTSGRLEAQNIPAEVVWNATHHGFKGASGGGVSDLFGLPLWQRQAAIPLGPQSRRGRGVPDVAGLADPGYGCEMLIAGRAFASAGTSAVAPMWAALVARLNQALGRRCGHLHSHIYRLGRQRSQGLRPVLKGDNGFYHAGEGWNACTGYGTPRGDGLLADLQKEIHPQASPPIEIRPRTRPAPRTGPAISA